MSDAQELYWDNTLEIIEALSSQQNEKIDLDSIGLDALYRMIIALPNFVDDPMLVNDGILMDILREWYEEIGNEWN